MKIKGSAKALIVLFGLAGLLRCQARPDNPAVLGAGLDEATREIVARMKGDAPFLVSPDCRQLLIKTELGVGRSELRLEDLETRRVLGRYAGQWPLLIGWRPRSAWISFVEEDRRGSGYRLKFWNPGDGTIVIPDVPMMPLANRFLRWSPNGRTLAFPAPGEKGRDQLRLLDATLPSAKSTAVFEAGGIADFDWSPDGSRIGVIAAENGGSVVLVDRGGRPDRRIVVSPGANLKQLAWLPGGDRLLIACRDPGQTAFALRQVDLRREQSVLVATPEGDVDIPSGAVMADGRFLFNAIQGGLKTLMLAGSGMSARSIGFEDGSSSLLSLDERRGDVLIAHSGVTQPSALYRVPLDGGAPALVYQGGNGEAIQAAAPARVAIPVPDGTTLPAYIWRAAARPSRGAVIAFPFVRTVPLNITFDGGRQYVVQKGYDYIMFGFRATTDNRRGWGTRINEDDLTSALAVVDYARRTLGAPADRIVLYGMSNGTIYATRTAARMREKRGGLLLKSLVSSLQSETEIPGARFRIAGLHGEYDPFPAPAAKATIERIFGPDALGGSNGFWRVLPGEAHIPVFTQSKALVYAAMIRLLEGGP